MKPELVRLPVAMLIAALTLLVALPAGAEVLTLSPDGWRSVDAAPNTSSGKIIEIRRKLSEGEYKQAAKLADDFINNYQSSTNANDLESAMSLKVEALIAKRKYWKAFESCEQQIKRFPAGKLIKRALGQELEIAATYLSGAKKYLLHIIPYVPRDDAIEILHRVRERAGISALAIQSIMIEADYYVLRKEWSAAYDTYLLLRKTAANPDTALEATIAAADAAYNNFEGVYWDDTPLLEAEQLYKSFLASRNEGKLAEHAAKRLVIIENLRAEKDYRIAAYYERTENHRSALYYYRQVATMYPATKWGEKAKANIEAFSGKAPKTVSESEDTAK